MTTLLETLAPAPDLEERAERGGLTLEDRLGLVLDALRADGHAECPVCRGPLTAAGYERARCGDCGSEIS